jgi:hypothetical protein
VLDVGKGRQEASERLGGAARQARPKAVLQGVTVLGNARVREGVWEEHTRTQHARCAASMRAWWGRLTEGEVGVAGGSVGGRVALVTGASGGIVTVQSEQFQRGWERLMEVDADGGARVIESLRDVAPDLGRYVVEFAFGEIYQRVRDRLPARVRDRLPARLALGVRPAGELLDLGDRVGAPFATS